MSIQENIANKKEREEKVKKGELFIVDSFRNDVLIKTEYRTLKEMNMHLLNGWSLLVGDMKEKMR